MYQYQNNDHETQSQLAKAMGLAANSREFLQELKTNSEIKQFSVIAPEHDSDYYQLDFASGTKDAEEQTFTYGLKPKTVPIIFNADGEYVEHGWSDNAIDVSLPLADFVDKNYTLVDGVITPPSVDYLRNQIGKSVKKFTNDKRLDLIEMTDSTAEEREWWPEFSQQAIRFKNGNPTDEDIEDFTLEAEKRNKGETAEELALKTFAKSRLYNLGGRIINGLSKKAMDALANADDGIEILFGVIAELKQEANSEFFQLKSQFSK